MRIREETVMETKLKAMEGVNKVELFLWGFFYLKKKNNTHTHTKTLLSNYVWVN